MLIGIISKSICILLQLLNLFAELILHEKMQGKARVKITVFISHKMQCETAESLCCNLDFFPYFNNINVKSAGPKNRVTIT